MLQMHKDTISLTRELVRIPSINPPGAEAQMVNYIERWAANENFEVRRVSIGNGRDNLLLRVPAKNGVEPPLVFTGHTDVVPVRESELKRWTVDPFAGEIKDGWLWGRGAADMKGGLACALIAAAYTCNASSCLRRDLVLALTCDEEYFMRGSRALRSDPWLPQGSWLVVCEPTDLTLCRHSKGRTWARITLNGRTAHGSRPDQGINTIKLASRLINRLAEVDFGPNDPIFGDTFWQPLKIEAGIDPGIIPDVCVIEVDCRMAIGCDSYSVWSRMKDLLDKLHQEDPTFEYTIEVIDRREPWETPENHPLVQAFRHHSTVRESCFSGSTDANILRDSGLTPIICGPGSLDHVHHENEKVDLIQLTEATDLYKNLIESICC